MATATDDFNRAIACTLGANWTDLDTGWSIDAYAAYAASALECVAVYAEATVNFSDNHFSEGTVSGMAAGIYVGVMVQGKASSGFGDGYIFQSDSVQAYIARHVNGVRTNQQ